MPTERIVNIQQHYRGGKRKDTQKYKAEWKLKEH